MLNEVLAALNPQDGETYVDATFGNGGYTEAILKAADCKVIAIDRDPTVLPRTEELKALYGSRFEFRRGQFGDIKALINQPVNGVVFDIGVSSMQLDQAERGFSFSKDAPLDMRMSQQGETAADLVNTESREELARILRDYGEEPYAWQIAGKIVEARETAPILTTLQLADTVASAMPPAERRKNKNPSRRTFQALRIAVNHELDALEEGLDTIFDHLAPGGRLCVITFHSLEDRLVKNKFRRWSTACTCPPEFPVCVCGGKAKAKLITRKPIEADTQELEENRRSRSAHLRVLEKC